MDDDVNMSTETPQLSELIQSLEHATLMAKKLRSTATTAGDRHRIISALTSANLSLSAFLSGTSAGAGAVEPMVIADDGEEEIASKDSAMEKVEEKMREFLYIQNKRPKRPLSPASAAAGERRSMEERESVWIPASNFDPISDRLKNLDLVYQFHA
ncbi:hypothetical protein vseg_009303 [Gypsophila vaccaria]